MSKGKFWMVLGLATPYYRHPSKQSAAHEAERLARNNPGQEFVVLESLATVVKSDLHWELNDMDGSCCDSESDVPF